MLPIILYSIAEREKKMARAIKKYIHKDRQLEDELLEIFNHIGFGEVKPNGKAGNFAAQYVSFTLPASPNEMLTIPHTLGYIPTGLIEVGTAGTSIVPLNILSMDKSSITVSSSEINKKVMIIIW